MPSLQTSSLLLLLLLPFLCLPATTQPDINSPPKNRKQLLQIYLSSLCPNCTKFLTETLPTLTTPQVLKYVQIRLIPYGQSTTRRLPNTYTFNCERGVKECQGNAIILCAQSIYSEKAFPFIVCLGKAKKGWNIDGASCANKHSLNWQTIKNCTNTQWVRQQMYYAGLETKSAGVQGAQVFPSFANNGGQVWEVKDQNIIENICFSNNEELMQNNVSFCQVYKAIQ